MTSARLFRVQMPLFAAVVATTVVGCASLVPARGLVGAAQAYFFAVTAQLLGVAAVNVYALGRLGAGRSSEGSLYRRPASGHGPSRV
jgi:hypothetical protein